MSGFGWRKRIGFIAPTVIEVKAYDFYRVVPDGVGMVGVTCNIEGWARDQYEAALAKVDEAAAYLASRNVDFIMHCGAPLVVSRGKGFDLELIDRIQQRTGIPASTTVRASVDGLQHLGVRTLVMATPFPEQLNRQMADYVEAHGFQVAHVATMDLDFKAIQTAAPTAIYRFAVEAARAAPRAEGIYMPCPQWSVSEVVDVIERDTGLPVVASAPAEFWTAFRRLNIRDQIIGAGRLLASLSEERAARAEPLHA